MIVIHLLVIACAILAFGPRLKRWPAALPLVALAAVIAFIAFDTRPMRTIITVLGAPSITTVALLVDLASRRIFGRPLFQARERRMMLWFLAAALIVVYPTALGFVRIFDFYRTGFLAAAPGVLAAAGIFLLLRRQYGAAAVALIALLALDVPLLPSVNVFDYLVDPFGGIAALGWAIVQLVKAIRRRFTAAAAPAAQPVAGDVLEPA
jgi:hypothetical protein